MTYDSIIVGLGGMGSAAAFHLSRRGQKVLGFEPHPTGHDRGSSHGQTRITRQAYFEHPDYVPLLVRAHELWHELNHLTKKELFHQVGLLCMGHDGKSEILGNILKSSNQFGIPTKTLTSKQLRDQYPVFSVADSHYGVLEPGAGYLEVENCVKAHWQLAEAHGATLKNQAVSRWEADDSGVTVWAGDEKFKARSLIFTAGAWTSQLLESFPMKLTVRSAVQFWFEPHKNKKLWAGLPCFAFDTAGTFIYGFPFIEGQGLKIADYAPAYEIKNPSQKPTTYDASDLAPITACIKKYIPNVETSPRTYANCMYTLSPDKNFVVDQVPGHSNVWVAGAGSGHAFKMTAVIGEVLADLVTTGETPLPIGFLRLQGRAPA